MLIESVSERESSIRLFYALSSTLSASVLIIGSSSFPYERLRYQREHRPIACITNMLLYRHIPKMRAKNPKICRPWNVCHPNHNEAAHTTRVRTESKTIRVVADNFFVTVMPAKLKNAIEIIVPPIAITSRQSFDIWMRASITFSSVPVALLLNGGPTLTKYMGMRSRDRIENPNTPSQPTACKAGMSWLLTKCSS